MREQREDFLQVLVRLQIIGLYSFDKAVKVSASMGS